MTFKVWQLNCMTFQTWKRKFLNSTTRKKISWANETHYDLSLCKRRFLSIFQAKRARLPHRPLWASFFHDVTASVFAFPKMNFFFFFGVHTFLWQTTRGLHIARVCWSLDDFQAVRVKCFSSQWNMVRFKSAHKFYLFFWSLTRLRRKETAVKTLFNKVNIFT